MILQAAILAIFALKYGQAQDANCDYLQNVIPGQSYQVFNPNYPNRYPAGVQCRWIGVCPTGYNCRLDCSNVDIPESAGCASDRLMISKTGDPQLVSADVYCGRGTVSTVSTGQRISVGLVSARNSPGGIFTCTLYAQAASTPPPTCSCGAHRTNRIVGGQETGINEYPSMVGLVQRNVNVIYCGGVIIDKRYVLTAAHCVFNVSAQNLGVIIGEHNVNTGDSPATQGIAVSRITIHTQYNSNNYDYDAAILTLATDIPFSDRVGPVCLPFKYANADFAGQIATALGWGTLFIGGPQSNVLRKVDLNVITQSQCANSVSALTSRQMCTYTPGKDACQYDSGGPLLYTDPSSARLYSIGIISFGQFCANSGSPGIYTRVTQVLNWIESTTQVNYCKI